MMVVPMRFTEDELRRDINGLDDQIQDTAKPDDVNTKRVNSFLKQIAKDKRDKLATLRYRKSQTR